MTEPAVEDDPREAVFAAAGLLDGLEGEARRQRLALLVLLDAQGFGGEDLLRHHREGTLTYALIERAMGGPPKYREAELLERAGVSAAQLHALRQAIGLPVPERGEVAYTDADVEANRIAGEFLAAGIPEQDILDGARVLGRGLAQASDLMRETALRRVLEPGLSESELAERLGYSASALAPMLPPLVADIFVLHMRHIAQLEAIDAAERLSGELPGGRDVVVAFADLVGFTRVGEEVQPEELGRLAGRLDALASDTVQPPVTLVKTIGDAVLLVSPEPEPLLHSALALVGAADREGEDFPQLRVGLASGPALRRAGDWYGRAVNLSSRVTGVARPGSVLATRAVRDAARDGFRWSYAGERRLKGSRARYRCTAPASTSPPRRASRRPARARRPRRRSWRAPH
jgi:adenylate cyclase